MENAGVSAFRRTLFLISKELTDSEVQQLKFLCKDHVALKQRENITDALGLFEILEQLGIISEADCTFLIGRMEDLQRSDLKKKLQQIGTESKADQSDSRHSRKQSQEPGISTSSASGSRPSGDRCPKTYELIRSPFTAGNSINSEYNYDSSSPGSSFASTEGFPAGSAPGNAVPNAMGGVSIKAVDSPIIGGHSIGNKFNYGGKKSARPGPQASKAQPRPISSSPSSGAEASGATQGSSTQQGTHPPPLPISTLKTPADFYPHCPKETTPNAAGQGSSGSLSNPPSSGRDPRLDIDAAPDSPQSNATQFSNMHKMKTARGIEMPILDSPNVMTPASSRHLSGDGCYPVKAPQKHDGSSLVDSSTGDDLETDAPQVLKVNPDDALLVDVQGVSHAPLLSQGADGNGEIARIAELRDVFDQGAQNPGAKAEEVTESYDVNATRPEGDAEVSEGGGCVVLRDYQHELAHYPLTTGGNYIICAPTGSGKTLTAASICYEKYTKYQASPLPGRHFKALFIVHIRLLKQQQRDAFQEYFRDSLSIRTIGEKQLLEHALAKDEALPVVLALTAQLFVNALRQKTVTLQDIDMLIIDECHHTDLLHPYNVIMQTYLKEKAASTQGVGEHVKSLPQVIGLSASLGVGHGGMALDHLLKLCANMDVRDIKRVCEHKKQLGEFVKAPEQDVMLCVPPRVTTQRHFGHLLEEIMEQMEDQLKATEKSALPRRGCQPYENKVIESQETAEHGDMVLYMYLNAYNRALVLYEDLPVHDCLQTLEEFYNNRSVCQNGESTPQEKLCLELFDTHLHEMKKMAREEGEDSNPKLQKLVELLADQFTKNPTSKGIVLTRMKVATVALCEFIRSSRVVKDLPHPVRPGRLVGQGQYEAFCMTESEQKMILESFRLDDGCNVLVATDIAQEGLDMPACNFVIRYNFVSNEIGTVQSKGRARAEGSQCFLIVERGSFNEQRELENRDKVRRMEEAMDKLEALPEEERLRCIKEKQTEIIDAMAAKERRREQRVTQMAAQQIVLICAECKRPVCKSSDLRRKGAGGYITCIDPEIESRITDVTLHTVAQRFRDSQSVCKIKCSNPECKNLLGTRETFFLLSDESPGFNLRAKSFLIHGSEKKLKKWTDLAIIEDGDL